MTHYHPCKNDQGKPVYLHAPHQPTALATLSQTNLLATVLISIQS